MAIREKISEAAAELNDNLEEDAAAAEQQAQPSRSLVQRARAVLQTSDDSQARQRAKAILARAAPETKAGQVDSREKSRTQRMFERAERSAKMAAPIEANLDPTPDPQAMWAFGMASPQQGEAPEGGNQDATPGVSAELSPGNMGDMARIDADGLLFSVGPDPDWEDNPDDLDTPEEVRDDLRDSGLNPMNVGSEDEATFGHFLVHAFADDDDLGGRTPEQLEAEHDLTVGAMLDFGVGHHSPMDRSDVGVNPFDFADGWGLTWDEDDSQDQLSGGGRGWF